jgi:putative heme-binding domain-containing protein
MLDLKQARRTIVCSFLAMLALACMAGICEDPLHTQLAGEGAEALAKAARLEGDARRGAAVFYQPQIACTSCHTAGEELGRLGPDLAKAGKDASDVYLVESILSPSKDVKKGFETITVATAEGRTVSGLFAEERADALVLRDATQAGKLITIAKSDIVARRDRNPSLMPEGLANGLGSRQEFLDLARFLMEIAEKGPERARELRPPTVLVAPPVPAYEHDLDHAGLLKSLDAQSFKRGAAIYDRVCANCHGTKDKLGSMPTSLRFAEGAFKNGSDPLSMYRTLTHGYGLMTPQTWMVPQQKYDVIHYIRETYLKPHNPTQYAAVDAAYLTRLPKGTTRGPLPSKIEPWSAMDYGPTFTSTYEAGYVGNIAQKGIAVRLDAGAGGVSRGRHWMLYEHDTLRVAAAWSGEGFVDWEGVQFNGKHAVHPHLAGQIAYANPVGPGWANPETGRFDDPRLRGRDDKPYGPLPRSWAHFTGLYHYGHQAILSYTVGGTPILDMPGIEPLGSSPPGAVVFTRTLNVGKSARDLRLRIAPSGKSVTKLGSDAVRVVEQEGFTLLHLSASATPVAVKLLVADCAPAVLEEHARRSPPPAALDVFTKGGPRRWPEILRTQPSIGSDTNAFAVDDLVLPTNNPWHCQIRTTGLDFYADGRRAAVCTWDGDVWLVTGVDRPEAGLTWQRIASGLFQPLGIKIVNEQVYLCCRDQIVILRDLNGDGETDFYENFNSDHQVTEHFHEFAMDLQVGPDSSFYYAKGARHALPAVVPQHGTLLRVSKDGSRTEIVATGFRAPNGVCLNPDGTFFITDQEGHWTPKNRLNWVKPGGFYGNMFGYHDITDASDAAMSPPICWITNAFDRSPSEMLWVPPDRWGALGGSVLNFSYGYGKIYVVLRETVDGVMQGGMVELPIPQFPTGVMRGRFHPQNGHLYCCGMFSWAGNQTQPGGLYRVRRTEKPLCLPLELHAAPSAISLRFSSPLDARAAADASNFSVKIWSLLRSKEYGSKHIDEKSVRVAASRLSADGMSVVLEIPDLKPTMGMEIRYALRTAAGEVAPGVIHNTIHRLK